MAKEVCTDGRQVESGSALSPRITTCRYVQSGQWTYCTQLLDVEAEGTEQTLSLDGFNAYSGCRSSLSVCWSAGGLRESFELKCNKDRDSLCSPLDRCAPGWSQHIRQSSLDLEITLFDNAKSDSWSASR
jgi:hypothetical protein